MEKLKELLSRITERINFNSIRQKMMTDFSVDLLFTVIISELAITKSIQSSKRREEAALVNERLLKQADEDDDQIEDFIGQNHQWTESMLNEVFDVALEGNDAIAFVSEESATGLEETSASTEEINSSMDEITNKSESIQHIAARLDALIHQIKI